MNIKTRSMWGALIFSAFFLLSIGLFIYWLSGARIAPEVNMTLIIIAGVCALLATLTTTTVVISALNMGDHNQALGLPRGSVRAMIALSLIIVFAMTSLFVYRELDFTYIIIDVNGTRVAQPPSQEKIQVGQQLVTTVSTLVVAVSSFYFGSRSGEAKSAIETPSLSITSHTSPVILDPAKDSILKSIKIKTTPRDEAVDWEVEPEDSGDLVQVKPNEFLFKRTRDEKDTVKLIFSLLNYPDISETLEIKIK